MTSSRELHVRPAEPRDRNSILAMVPRLVEFGPPRWRDPVLMTQVVRQMLDGVLQAPPRTSTIFIAEEGDGTPLGFIHLETATDYFTHEAHGHISDLVVAEAGEGRGIARALIEAGDAWARGRGYRLLTLNVFTENQHARAVYRRLGYGEDTIRYVKPLD